MDSNKEEASDKTGNNTVIDDKVVLLEKQWQTTPDEHDPLYRDDNGRVKVTKRRFNKADAVALVTKLGPLESRAHIMLAEAVEEGKPWAIKMYFEYMYGKPKQIIEVKKANEDIEQVFKVGKTVIKI
jgi:hypothetical protein